MYTYKRPSLSGSTLKIFAIVTMMIDHTGAALVGPLRYFAPENMQHFFTELYPVTRAIGRLAFPVFCFLLVEGFIHTRSTIKYALRLFLFALISELPFDFALANNLFSWHHQNVYFTLLIGLLVMMGVTYFEQRPTKNALQRWFSILMEAAILAGGLYLAKVMYTDYGFKGVFLIEVLYFLRFDRRLQSIFGAIAISWEAWAPLSFILVWFYNGTRGKQMKYFFYWFYPVHLIILGFLKLAITGQFRL